MIRIQKFCILCGEIFWTDDPEETKCELCRSTLNEFADDQELWSRELEVKGASYTDWFVIIGQLQLALRHPQNVGPAAELARIFARQLAKRIIDGIPSFTNNQIKKMKWDTELGVSVSEQEKGDNQWMH